MGVLRRTALAVLVIAMSTAVPARAEPGHTLRLSGSSTGFVDFTLSAPTTFDEMSSRLRTKGTYVGWWLARLGEPVTERSDHAGAVRFVAQSPRGFLTEVEQRPNFRFGANDSPLRPGRYRLYLATDGAAVVDVPIRGLRRSLNLSPTRATTSRGIVATIGAAPGPGGVVVGDARETFTFPPNSLAASTTQAVAGPGVTVYHLSACVTSAALRCPPDSAATAQTFGPSARFFVQATSRYLPGTLSPGAHDGVQSAAAGPAAAHVVGSLFQLTTVP